MRKTSAYARRRWAPDPLASLRLLDRARPFDPGDTTEQHIKTRAAFERLGNGTADNDDFDRVAMSLNLAKVRALEIDRGLADLLEAGQLVMTEKCVKPRPSGRGAVKAVRKRHDKWAKWEVLPAERTAIVDALDAHEAITDASSPLQMYEALDVVRRSVLANMRKA